jgi:hypothetical protein
VPRHGSLALSLDQGCDDWATVNANFSTADMRREPIEVRKAIVSKRLGSHYRSGRSPDWLKFKNPEAPAVKRETEEDWGR